MNVSLSFYLRTIGRKQIPYTGRPLRDCAHFAGTSSGNNSVTGVTLSRRSHTMASEPPLLKTTVLPVDATKLGSLKARTVQNDILDDLDIELDPNSVDAQYLRQAAEQLKTSDIPVAFPTETVYGLGADATRSSATRGIYKAKQRPADNPLIVHFASLRTLSVAQC